MLLFLNHQVKTSGLIDGPVSSSRFTRPVGIAVSGNYPNTVVYVTDASNRVRAIDLTTQKGYISSCTNIPLLMSIPTVLVLNVAGSSTGYTDGASYASRFDTLAGIAIDFGSGFLFFSSAAFLKNINISRREPSCALRR